MPAERKRPWYLVVALLGALALGMSGASNGWSRMAGYFGTVDPTSADAIADEADRARVLSCLEGVYHAMDAGRSRGWPLTVATLLLGGATFLFAMRVLTGSAAARPALVQLVAAQAAVGIASHFLMRDVIEAELRLAEAIGVAQAHAAGGAAKLVEVQSLGTLRAMANLMLGLQAAAAALVVLGLTRHGSRAYFDERAAPAEGG